MHGINPTTFPNVVSYLSATNHREIVTGDRAELQLPLHALEELRCLLDRPRHLLLELHQHVAVGLLHQSDKQVMRMII